MNAPFEPDSDTSAIKQASVDYAAKEIDKLLNLGSLENIKKAIAVLKLTADTISKKVKSRKSPQNNNKPTIKNKDIMNTPIKVDNSKQYKASVLHRVADKTRNLLSSRNRKQNKPGVISKTFGTIGKVKNAHRIYKAAKIAKTAGVVRGGLALAGGPVGIAVFLATNLVMDKIIGKIFKDGEEKYSADDKQVKHSKLNAKDIATIVRAKNQTKGSTLKEAAGVSIQNTKGETLLEVDSNGIIQENNLSPQNELVFYQEDPKDGSRSIIFEENQISTRTNSTQSDRTKTRKTSLLDKQKQKDAGIFIDDKKQEVELFRSMRSGKTNIAGESSEFQVAVDDDRQAQSNSSKQNIQLFTGEEETLINTPAQATVEEETLINTPAQTTVEEATIPKNTSAAAIAPEAKTEAAKQETIPGLAVVIQALETLQKNNPNDRNIASVVKESVESLNEIKQQTRQKEPQSSYRGKYNPHEASTKIIELFENHSRDNRQLQTKDYNIERKGKNYLVSDKEGNIVLEARNTMFGTKVIQDNASDRQKQDLNFLKEDLEAQKPLTGSFKIEQLDTAKQSKVSSKDPRLQDVFGKYQKANSERKTVKATKSRQIEY